MDPIDAIAFAEEIIALAKGQRHDAGKLAAIVERAKQFKREVERDFEPEPEDVEPGLGMTTEEAQEIRTALLNDVVNAARDGSDAA